MQNGIVPGARPTVESLERRDVPSAVSAALTQVRHDVLQLVHDSRAALQNVQPAAMRQQLQQDLQTLRNDVLHQAYDAVFADISKLGTDLTADAKGLRSVLNDPTVQADLKKLLADGKAAAQVLGSSFTHAHNPLLNLGHLFHGRTPQAIEKALAARFQTILKDLGLSGQGHHGVIGGNTTGLTNLGQVVNGVLQNPAVSGILQNLNLGRFI